MGQSNDSRGEAVKAVIFDIDGTLLDSVGWHAKAWVDAFAHFGVAVSEPDARRQIGKGGDQLLPVFLDAARVEEDGETIETFRSDLFKRRYLDQVTPFPGVRDLLERVREAGQIVALASSGKEDEVAHYQKILGIGDLVDISTSSGDAERSKPYPDIFEAAMRKLAPIPVSQAVAVGDTPYDAEAAAKIGLETIGVLSGGFPEADLRAAGCTAIYRDVQDLLDNYATSALARTGK